MTPSLGLVILIIQITILLFIDNVDRKLTERHNVDSAAAVAAAIAAAVAVVVAAEKKKKKLEKQLPHSIFLKAKVRMPPLPVWSSILPS